jgi:type I restriction enzyme R subunit
MPNFISEDQIEIAITAVFTECFRYRAINCYTPDPEMLPDGSGRSDKRDVVFLDILKTKAREFNPHIPENTIDQAIVQLTASRYAMSPILANKEVYNLIRDGIPVQYQNAKGKMEQDSVKVINFNQDDNDFLVVRQLWIKGDHYFRRPDIILYINGLPLVFIELKNSNVPIKAAYDDNLTNYRKDIPQLFQYNVICILSNAIETKVGSMTAGWEFFFNWFRVDDETEKIDRNKIKEKGISLEKVVLGLCARERLLDYIENFILYHKENSKIIAENHQFIGVNKAIDAFADREKRNGKLGVFWHTQGSGKSFSMIFLTRKIFRKFTGNFTFVIITDRDDLDGQIYKNFLHTDTVKKKEQVRPKDSAEMRDYLSRNLRFVFTLIHKFRWDKGKDYPLLSDRKDIIVIVDEAHRTQYKSLAENMRVGLPNAQYLAFTGTPLLGKGRKTNAWFGDYISEYNFAQSMDDETTVPLFYQKRVPEVLIQNESLSDEFYEILENDNVDPANQEKLEKEFAKELEIIKRDDRLETIARDIVYHFPHRGYLGKGMVISVDKFTSVKMYDKVQKHWKEAIKKLIGDIKKAHMPAEKERLQAIVDYMRKVEMAVVISEEAGEEEKFDKQELDIRQHRKKMNAIDKNGHDIEYRFKDPGDKLQLVFVCAMWLTGFDAPTVSTLYLDKPMKDHTLMQTIARANRVTSYTINGVSKRNGEIIDYYNVFRNMKKALVDYALGSEGKPEEEPVQDKSVLFDLLDDAINQGQEFLETLDIAIASVLERQEIFKKIEAFDTFANKILEKDEYRKQFFVYENTVSSLYEACKPEVFSEAPRPLISVFQYLRGIIDSIVGGKGSDEIKKKISDLLDQSIITSNQEKFVSEGNAEYQIVKKGRTWDLGKIDFDKLKEDFKETKYRNIEIADLRAFLEKKLEQMMKENSTRTNFAHRLQEIIDRYNSGGSTNENYFDELIKFTSDLKEEAERHIREGLTQDELELYDILKKDKMTKTEEQRVKLAAKALLHRLLEEQPKVLLQDWYKDSQSQSRVRSAVEEVLDHSLPETYDKDIFQQKCRVTYNLIYDYALKGIKWVA